LDKDNKKECRTVEWVDVHSKMIWWFWRIVAPHCCEYLCILAYNIIRVLDLSLICYMLKISQDASGRRRWSEMN
jgi:hypothetical protein